MSALPEPIKRLSAKLEKQIEWQVATVQEY